LDKITPFLWFDRQAEEAARFYVSLFDDSEILQVTHYSEGMPMPKGTVLTVVFRLAGREYIALNGGPEQKLSPAFSLTVNCKDQREIDHYWAKLGEGGKDIQCGWLVDRFGLSWQVVPENIQQLLSSEHPEKANRVLQAIMGMVKLDKAALERAYNGG
jgi:predicted 3-demethylubiquinone-9 3-methyltransferase (glyoxalase superfamily)